MRYNLNDIVKYLPEDYKILGNMNAYFTNIKSIFDAESESLIWVNPTRHDRQTLLQNTAAKIIICDFELNTTEKLKDNSVCVINVKNPKLVFLRIAGNILRQQPVYTIHKTCIIEEGSSVHKNVFLGPNVYVGKNCTIDEGSVIQGNCHIYDNTVIGKNVTVNAGTVIGADGFGYQRNEKNELEKFIHIGGVIIEDDVEIGTNTSIDRGTLGNTLIKTGVKIDNLVHIAHNVTIGKHTMIIANSLIGGSTIIGDHCWIAPSATIRDAVNVGDNVTIGMGAVVTKDIPSGEIWAGSPARRMDILKEQIKKLENL